jgi:LacI family transcriptional regulator
VRKAPDKRSKRDRAIPIARKATLHDVADATGVSPMTVSNVINGRFLEMTRETRERVEDAINKLNYRPHMQGRRLRSAKNLSVGVIIVHEIASFLADPFITQLIAGLNNHLFTCGYGLFLQGLRPDQLEHSNFVRNIETDGLCALVSGPAAARKRLLKSLIGLGQPLIIFQEIGVFRDKDVCVIRQDDFGGASLIAKHVLSQGVRNLVYLQTSLEWAAVEERLRGIRHVFRNVGGAKLRAVSGDSLDFAATQNALRKDLDVNGVPDAILAANDQLANAAMKLLVQRGFKIPSDVKVTGFNGFEFWQYSDPILTTTHSPAYEMGILAGKELLQRLHNGAFSKQSFVLPVSLQPGGSA